MVLDTQRTNIDPLITAFARRFSFIEPNTITWISLIFAVLAGFFFYLSTPEGEPGNSFLLFASLFVFFNGFFDAIDGKVAKLTNKISSKGDFLDHALDRYSDVFMVGGLALSGWCDAKVGLLAIVGMLLTSYMGTQSQAVGYNRDYRGLLGRADRLVLLMVFPIVQHVFVGYEFPYGISVLEWVLIYFAVVGNITALQRFYRIIRWFRKEER